MKIVIFSFTGQGAAKAAQLSGLLAQAAHEVSAYGMPKYAIQHGLLPMECSISELTAQYFDSADALIYIGACGIALRAVAPFIRSKTTDPCVLSIDEAARFVIPLLSGHIGGGNALAREAALLLHATPVISTATDINGCFAVDVFATENDLTICDMQLAKEISAALLDGETIGMTGELPTGVLPHGLCSDLSAHYRLGICISPFDVETPFDKTLYLIPRQVVLGIGCRKDVAPDDMDAFVTDILAKEHLHPASLLAIASISLKKDEPCLTELAKRYQVPFYTYSADELAKVEGAHSSSEYVKNITGVDNVCERAALLCSGAKRLLLQKTIASGKTIAIALSDKPLHF